MRWTPRGRSRNLEDRRGARPGMRIAGVGGGLGIGGILLLLVLSFVFKTDLFQLVGGGVPAPAPGVQSAPIDDPQEEEMVQFVSFVLDDAQATWSEILGRRGGSYPEARLVLFRQAVDSGCGYAQSAMGPFYCPRDERVYVDLDFFDELRRRFGAPGDFAQAYVLAHEIGHHVQHVLGIESQVRAAQGDRPDQRNPLSVALELQADCFAGVWAHSTAQRDRLDPGDIEEGMGAAAAVGDDRIQEMSGSSVQPESFTHGSSEQRVSWFRRGLQAGSVEACDTFQR